MLISIILTDFLLSVRITHIDTLAGVDYHIYIQVYNKNTLLCYVDSKYFCRSKYFACWCLGGIDDPL